MKKILSLVLVLAMVLGLSVPAFAEDVNYTFSLDGAKAAYSITVTNYEEERTWASSKWEENKGMFTDQASWEILNADNWSSYYTNLESMIAGTGKFTEKDGSFSITRDDGRLRWVVLVLTDSTVIAPGASYTVYYGTCPANGSEITLDTANPIASGKLCTDASTAKSDSVTITATVAKPELVYEIVIPEAVTMTKAGVKEIGAASIKTDADKLKNATANTVISYTATGTDFKLLTDETKTMTATYYSAYTDKDTNTVLDSKKAIEVYKNSALVDPLTKLYVGVSQTDWDNAAKTNPGTYTATVTYNFKAEEKTAKKVTIADILPSPFPTEEFSSDWSNSMACNLWVEDGNLNAKGGSQTSVPVSTELTLVGDKYTCTTDTDVWTFTMDGESFCKATISDSTVDFELNGDYEITL